MRQATSYWPGGYLPRLQDMGFAGPYTPFL